MCPSKGICSKKKLTNSKNLKCIIIQHLKPMAQIKHLILSTAYLSSDTPVMQVWWS